MTAPIRPTRPVPSRPLSPKESKRQDLLNQALDALHQIGGAFTARELLKGKHLSAPLRESMNAKALTDEQIEQLALDTWESIVTEMQKP